MFHSTNASKGFLNERQLKLLFSCISEERKCRFYLSGEKLTRSSFLHQKCWVTPNPLLCLDPTSRLWFIIFIFPIIRRATEPVTNLVSCPWTSILQKSNVGTIIQTFLMGPNWWHLHLNWFYVVSIFPGLSFLEFLLLFQGSDLVLCFMKETARSLGYCGLGYSRLLQFTRTE